MNSSLDPNRVHSRHPAARALLLVLAAALALGFGGSAAIRGVLKTLYPLQAEKEVEIGCRAENLEPALVFAVIKCESGFDERAVSSVGARGLMQLMPETFAWLQSKTGESYQEDALFDPEINVRYGCYLLHILLSTFGGETETAVAAYHAGIGNVENWLQDERYSDDGITLRRIPFASTAAYVKKVKKAQRVYAALYDFH